MLSVRNLLRFLPITLIVFLPLFGTAQNQGLTGLWTGALSSDSNSVRKDQSFEIALTEYKGKVYGYSRSEFIVNDTLYYILKRVKGEITGDTCEVKDDEIVSYNFRGKLDKGVKVISTFYRNKVDSTWYLAGKWKTSQTKKFYSVTGKVDLQEEKDLSASKLFPHLEELKLANDVAFYKEQKDAPVIVKIAKPEKIKSEYTDKKIPVTDEPVSLTASATPGIQPIKPAVVPEVTAAIVNPKESTENKKTEITQIAPVVTPDKVSSVSEPVAANKPVTKPIINQPESVNTPVTIKPKDPVIARNDKPVTKPVQTVTSVSDPVVVNSRVNTKPAAVNQPSSVSDKPAGKTNPVSTQPAIVSKPEIKTVAAESNPVVVQKPVITDAKPVVTDPAKTTLVPRPEAALAIDKRKSEVSQIVYYRADSLELVLYDNGEIDGDTVSVLMNNDFIFTRQGLKATAAKKMIYLPAGSDEDFTITLYAENLGKYPPNTGLLVIHDGEDTYNLRFSADYDKNAKILFKRKKNNQ